LNLRIKKTAAWTSHARRFFFLKTAYLAVVEVAAFLWLVVFLWVFFLAVVVDFAGAGAAAAGAGAAAAGASEAGAIAS